MSVPTNRAILHRSFVRSLRAENRSPRTVEAYSLAIDQLAEYCQGRDDIPPTTTELRREHIEGYLITITQQGRAAATLNQTGMSLDRYLRLRARHPFGGERSCPFGKKHGLVGDVWG